MKITIRNIMTKTLLLLIVSGCTNSPVLQAKDNVLVLDVAAIAKAIDRDTLMNQQIAQEETRLKQQLVEFKEKLTRQLLTKKNEFQSKTGNKAQQMLQNLSVQAEQKMQAAILKARQQIQQYKVKLLKQFQDELKPIAEKIAKNREASIVRFSDATILWNSDSVDITNEVISKLRKQINK